MLNNEAFRQAIRIHGERVQLLRAMPCACYNPALNYDAQRGCDRCEHGYAYQAEAEARGLVTQQKHSMVHPEYGLIGQSQLYLTTMPDEVNFGPFDKVVLLERTGLARERAVRGTDELPHATPVEVLQVADTEYAAPSPTYDEGDAFDLVGATLQWASPVMVAGGALVGYGAARCEGAFVVRGGFPHVLWQIGPSATYAVEYTYTATYWYTASDMRPPWPTFGRGATGLTMPQTPQRGLLSLSPPSGI